MASKVIRLLCIRKKVFVVLNIDVAKCNLGKVKYDYAGQRSPPVIVCGVVLRFSRVLVIL